MFPLSFELSSDHDIEKVVVRKINCMVTAGKSLVNQSIAYIQLIDCVERISGNSPLVKRKV